MAIFNNLEDLPDFHNSVITIGTFDGVHKGHKAILQEVVRHARAINGESILLTFEPHPRKILFPDKPLKLITPLGEKLELITAEGIQHIVVVPFTRDFSNLSAEEYISDFLVRNFAPHGIVIGYDHHFGHDRSGNINLLEKLSGKYNYDVYEIPAQLIDNATVSSTEIRNAITAGHVTEAAEMLGRPYSLKGTVVTGARLGRTIGYPTANIKPADPDQLIPANGVYAVLVDIDGQRHKAMLNIGNRPTVSKDIQLHIEAHIFDFSTEIYGKTVNLFFIDRIRDEVKFSSLDALKEQLDRDKETSLQILTGL